MRFYTKKRRAPSVIIVSLIDILAILLIFFIVTTTFRKDQPSLRINLPESKSAERGEKAPKDPLVLRVKNATEISLGSEPVAIDSLAQALQSAIANNPGRPLAMQADRDAPFGVVIKVLDALKQAGLQNIPTFTEPEAKKR